MVILKVPGVQSHNSQALFVLQAPALQYGCAYSCNNQVGISFNNIHMSLEKYPNYEFKSDRLWDSVCKDDVTGGELVGNLQLPLWIKTSVLYLEK